MADDERRSLSEPARVIASEGERPRWLAVGRDEAGRETLRIGVRGRDHIAEWPGLVRLILASDGTDPRYEVEVGAPPLVVTRIRSELGPALVHQARGGIAIHASCVAWENAAIAFVGDSGAGKSTLAAHLTEAAAGSLVADDATRLSPSAPYFVSCGAAPTHALDASSLAASSSAQARATGTIDARGIEIEKTLVTPRRVAVDRVPARAICVLTFNDAEDAQVRVEPVHGALAIAALVPHLIRLVVDDPARLAIEMDALGALAKNSLVFRLSRPRDLAAIDRVAHMLRETLGPLRPQPSTA